VLSNDIRNSNFSWTAHNEVLDGNAVGNENGRNGNEVEDLVERILI
jgi:hypothetical protein